MKLSQETMDFINSPDLEVDEVPDELFDMTRFCPKQNKPIDILKSYKLNKKVKCIFDHDHSSGFVVKFENDNYGAIGPKCAEDIFGKERCRQMRNTFRKRVNIERTKAAVRPNLNRNRMITDLLINFKEVTAQKDDFFERLGANTDFMQKLKGAGYEAGFGLSAIDTSAHLTLNVCLRNLKESSDFFSTEPLNETNAVNGERLYSRAKMSIPSVMDDLDACKRFFLPAGIKTYIRIIKNDSSWKKRVELSGEALVIDGNEIRVPWTIPSQLAKLEDAMNLIRSLLTKPLTEFEN